MLRPLLSHLGIRILTGPRGVAATDPQARTITMPADHIAWKGPFAREVRAHTSAMAWAFAHLRLAELGMEGDAHGYAAEFLCPLELLRLAPELAAIRRGAGVEELARRLAVAPWVVEEAVRRFGLADRVLSATKKEENLYGGTISGSESVPQREAMGGPAQIAGPHIPEN